MAVIHFTLLFLVLPKLLPQMIPKVSAMKSAERFHFTNEIACIAHHMLVIPPSLYALYVQASTPMHETPDMSFMVKAASLTCGYFAADLIICIPYFLKGQYLDFLVHHGLGILLVRIAVTNTFGARWVAWFLCSELTTVIFTYCKYLKKTVSCSCVHVKSMLHFCGTCAGSRRQHTVLHRRGSIRHFIPGHSRHLASNCVLLFGIWTAKRR